MVNIYVSIVSLLYIFICIIIAIKVNYKNLVFALSVTPIFSFHECCTGLKSHLSIWRFLLLTNLTYVGRIFKSSNIILSFYRYYCIDRTFIGTFLSLLLLFAYRIRPIIYINLLKIDVYHTNFVILCLHFALLSMPARHTDIQSFDQLSI